MPLRPLFRCIAFSASALREILQFADISIGSRCISILGSVVIFGPFYYETPYRDCAVATIFRGQIWDSLQLPPAVTRSRDPPLTHPRSSSLRTIRYRPTAHLSCIYNIELTNLTLPIMAVTASPSSLPQLQPRASLLHPCTLDTSGSVLNATKLPLASLTRGSAASLVHTR